MKLAAIYNVWADYDWLIHSVRNMHPLVDGVLIICSEYSNYREYCKQAPYWTEDVFYNTNVRTYDFEPTKGLGAMQNETAKRNFGLDVAKKEGFTHFLTMDCDEVYDPEQFIKEKQRFIDNPDLAGLVCASKVYVKSPTLTIGLDTTRVPFIHRITPTLRHEFNKRYPFAWEGTAIRIDPTRSLNINSGVEWSDIVMDHYSYVRSDLKRKIRNSTAKSNLEKSTILEDYKNACDGYYFRFYGKTLTKVDNKYNLPEMIDLSIT